MFSSRKEWLLWAIMLLVVGTITVSMFFETPYAYVQDRLGDNPIIAGAIYTALVFITTVAAPLAALPLAPAVSVIIGPFFTGFATVIGWTVGATVAFLIARHAGRPLLRRFVRLREIEKYERFIPEHSRFWWLVFLRVIDPTDMLSYVIGLFSSVRLGTYVLSTILGTIPFSFALAYGGNALIEGRYGIVTVVVLAGLLLFILSLYGYVRRAKQNR